MLRMTTHIQDASTSEGCRNDDRMKTPDGVRQSLTYARSKHAAVSGRGEDL